MKKKEVGRYHRPASFFCRKNEGGNQRIQQTTAASESPLITIHSSAPWISGRGPTDTSAARDRPASIRKERHRQLPRGQRGDLWRKPGDRGTEVAGDAREKAAQALGDLRGLRRGRLVIGASMTVGVYLLPELLAVELKVEIGNTTMPGLAAFRTLLE